MRITSVWFSIRVMRECAKRNCSALASVTVTLDYDTQEVLLGELLEEHSRESIEVCAPHAGLLRPPIGWKIVDRRTVAAAL